MITAFEEFIATQGVEIAELKEQMRHAFVRCKARQIKRRARERKKKRAMESGGDYGIELGVLFGGYPPTSGLNDRNEDNLQDTIDRMLDEGTQSGADAAWGVGYWSGLGRSGGGG